MLYSTFIKKLNTDVVVKGFVVTKDGGTEGIDNRKYLYSLYTGTVVIGAVRLGIRPMPVNVPNMLGVNFEIVVLHEGDNGGYTAIFVGHMEPHELRALADLRSAIGEIITHDLDIDSKLSEFGFKPIGG